MKFTIPVLISLIFVGCAIRSFAQDTLPLGYFQCKHHASAEVYNTTSFVGQSYDLKYHRAHWKVNPAERYIHGAITSYFMMTESDTMIDFELVDELLVDSVVFRSNHIAYTHQDDVLQLVLGVVLPEGALDSLTVYYQGVPPDEDSFGMGVQQDDSPTLWTLSEPYGAKTWWPSKNDLSDKIDSIDVIIDVSPIENIGVSNGLLIQDTIATDSSFRRFHWQHRYPIATYLVAVAAAEYNFFERYFELQEGNLRIPNYAYKATTYSAQVAVEGLEKAMALYDSLFMPYPFMKEHYGHAEMGRGGGMEHQTMTFMGTWSFHVISHEVAHQWFGNYITLNDWHDIWLNEGFATYLTGLAYEMCFDTTQWWDIWRPQTINHITTEPDGSVYVPDISDADRIFDGRLSYSKGAYVLHMIRWVLGDEAFFQAIRNYLQEESLAYNYSSQDDLINHFEQEGDTTLNEFFDDWYYGEGYPSYHVKSEILTPTKTKVTLSQEQSHSSVSFFEMPVELRFINTAKDTAVVLDHQYADQEFIVDLGFVPDSVFFDPEYHIISQDNTMEFNQKDDQEVVLLLMPNPAKAYCTIQCEQMIEKFEVFDNRGLRVLRNDDVMNDYFQIDVTALRKGMYFIQFRTIEGNEITEKLVVYD